MRPDVVVVFSRVLMIARATSMLANQLRSRQYSRNLPLKLSTKAFWVGLPGWMKCSLTPLSLDQKNMALQVSSAPWHPEGRLSEYPQFRPHVAAGL